MTFDGLSITIGCPGSGKSTWADKNLPAETLRLERDRFREALFGGRRAYHDSPVPRGERSAVITAAMAAAMARWPHKSWAVTDTGLIYDSVKPFIYHALWAVMPIRLIVIERDTPFLLTSNRVRPHDHRVPEDILLGQIDNFNDPAAWWRTSPYEKVFV